MTTAEATYDNDLTTRAGASKKRAAMRAIFDHLLPDLPARAKVLEAGPGRGEFARECLSRGYRYVGVDASDELCAKLRATGLEIHQATIPPLPGEDGTYDLVHSDNFVEHLCSYREVMDFFGESYRVLKPGGHVSVIAPNYATVKEMFFEFDYQHSYVTTRHRLARMLSDCGFAVTTSRSYLLWPARTRAPIDRVLAHSMIGAWRNPFIGGPIRLVASDSLRRKINKNLFDQVAVVARRPVE